MSALLDKMRELRASRTIHQAQLLGWENQLDLRALDEEEYLLFCRKVSLLQAKIQLKLESRSPDEAIQAMKSHFLIMVQGSRSIYRS